MATNYRDRLGKLAVSDPGLDELFDGHALELDPKSLALARFAALVAIGGAAPSFGEHADAALSAGATADDIVDVLVGVVSVVGAPRIVAAAPQVAIALGFDLDAEV